MNSISEKIPKLIRDDRESLIQPISIDEVHSVIWSLHLDKAPRPDGFPISFYRSCWHIIKKDLLIMLIWTQCKDKIGGATNSTFLALIPKEKKPTSIKRYRPISLCNYS